MDATLRRRVPAAADDIGAKASWFPVAVLAAAQFVMVLDSSVMNVSISQIVADLHTTIAGVQLAITAYTLVMAAMMLAGAKLGDILGRDKTFAIGLAVYGLGSLTTALSPNLTVLLIGWSLVEGLGAALVMPAIVSLVAAHYNGKQRAVAFGIIGGIAGAAIAAGPLIGGFVTTEFSWRYVFAGETVIVIGILAVRNRLRTAHAAGRRPQLDVIGVLISSLGLGLAVFGILKSSEWGFIEPRGALTIGGTEITPFGFSVVPFLILAGVGCLGLFVIWEERREREGKDTLLDRTLLKIETLRAGLTTLLMQQLILLGTFFVLPVYLQVVLGLDAFETGKKLFPMSVTMFVAAMLGPRLAAVASPKRVAQAGLARARGRGDRPARHDRRRAQRSGVRRRAGAVRGRRRSADVPARQRDHVVGRPVPDQRGRRPPGHGAEPGGVARHRADRLGADRVAHERLRQSRRGQPRDPLAGARSGDAGGGEGPHRRAGRRGRAGRARRGRPAPAGRGDSRRLRRGGARRAEARDRRGGRVLPTRVLVHAAAPRGGRTITRSI